MTTGVTTEMEGQIRQWMRFSFWEKENANYRSGMQETEKQISPGHFSKLIDPSSPPHHQRPLVVSSIKINIKGYFFPWGFYTCLSVSLVVFKVSVGNQSWTFNGRTDAEAKASIFWPSDMKSQLIGKDPDAGKDWGQEEKGTTEDEMAGWHHWLNGRELEQTLGDNEGQGSLVCCSLWGCKELDMT